jgi:hypothetical protein
MNQVHIDIATNAADYAVGKYGQHLSKGKQMALWQRHYDCALGAMLALEDAIQARKVRARAFISLN